MISSFLEKTAWPMTPPLPWSVFHVAFLLLGISGSVCLTRFFYPPQALTKALPPRLRKPADPVRILWVCGIILACGEVYKQLFLYHVVNGGRYDWWYFPFQLCSTPMYLCLVLPALSPGRLRDSVCVYLQSFGFLGGVMALLEPSGLMHPYWTLTLHGLLWHVLLIFIACCCTASGIAGPEASGILPALPLFFLFCLAATAVNILTEGRADMFYISPYYPITQVVFHQISVAMGIGPGIAVYLAFVCAGAFASRRLLNRLFSLT